MFYRHRPEARAEKLKEVKDDSPTPKQKLAELILYIAHAVGGRVGATKLNKFLYFADFSSMRRLGHPVTGVEYRRLPKGPAPRCLQAVRSALVGSNDARLEKRQDAFGYVHHELLAMRAPRKDYFGDAELCVVDDVIAALRTMTAAEISELSHQEAGWQITPDGETIPYVLAFAVAPNRAPRTPTIIAEGERLRRAYERRLAEWPSGG